MVTGWVLLSDQRYRAQPLSWWTLRSHKLLYTPATSAAAPDRVLAADLLAMCAQGAWMDRSLLRPLLLDPDDSVAVAALAAVRWPTDQPLGPVVVDLLGIRGTAHAAVERLVAGGADVVGLVEACLEQQASAGHRAQTLCARVCREIGGPEAAAVLRRHVRHPDRDVGLAVTRALATVETRVDATNDRWISDLVTEDLEDAAHLVHAIEVLGPAMSAGPLLMALADELSVVRRRVMAGLALRHGTEAMDRVEFQLAQESTRVHALALEWLDVTLTGSDRRAMVLLDPGTSPADQVRAFGKHFAIVSRSAADLIAHLAEDAGRVWRRPWISACALVAAASSDADLETLGRLAHEAHPDPEGIVRETVAAITRREHLRHA